MTQYVLTQYLSPYYAWLLTRRTASDTVESLATTLADSQVDLKLRREPLIRQDKVEAQRNNIISQLEVQLQQQVEMRTLSTIEWELA